MNYIVLDLEWNQAYAQMAMAVQKRISLRLRGEVIQIGAVKLNESLVPCGSYSICVKPKFFKKIQRHVMKLTGIDQDMLDRGSPLPEAIEGFRRWCGEDFAFLTWGPDDIPMLKDNLRAHKLDCSWLERDYDLQIIFNRQTDGQKKQRSLEYAMELFGIEQNLPPHDALNDAYFTALVASKLDIARGISTYSDGAKEFLLCETIGDADSGEVGFESESALLSAPIIAEPTCPICHKPIEDCSKILHSKGHKYIRLITCSEHGSMTLTAKAALNINGTWRAKVTAAVATEEDARSHADKLALSTRKSSTRRRRRHRKPSGSASHTPAASGGDTNA